MGLFQRKKEEHTITQPLYSIGQSKSLLVVGLGNIGSNYAKNRHNAGFIAVDRYKSSHEFSDWVEKKDLQAYLSLGRVGSTRVLLAKPTTMMNASGEAVQRIQKFYKLSPEDTLILYDELDVDFGVIKTRSDGGSAGHNGIKSIIQHTNKNFGRVRIGIGPKKPEQIDSADFVLQNFNKDEQELLPKILRECSAIIDERTVGLLADNTIKV